ncbi:hypothetical protein XELAEV_18039462mg [Xenopus laevis]|uniref:MADF domain-containing protein n=1 Tax=Xenopus laevis TaxID=8355 RepID=A0A974C8Q6_XENLA|nr:hypothetical protein XELAEV_18039462mg [Xenopus laevis]
METMYTISALAIAGAFILPSSSMVNLKTKMKSREKTRKAYEELVNLVKSVCQTADVQFVKTKISNIHTAFKKELNKVHDSKKSGASADDIYRGGPVRPGALGSPAC